jgi:hypothetical protein
VVTSDRSGYVVGPSLEFRIVSPFSIGFEALYKPLHYQDGAVFQNGEVIGFAPNTVLTWQFPVLGKHGKHGT